MQLECCSSTPGTGSCESGDVIGLENGVMDVPEISEVIDTGDFIAEAVNTVKDDAAAPLAPAAVTGK